LLKCDADGPNWTDLRVAEAFDCRTKTVENIRQRLVTEGFEETLHRRQPETAPRAKILDGAQEAQIIALRLAKPPKGFSNWSLRLLADKVVELGIVEKVSHETVRKTLKKWHDATQDSVLGHSPRGERRICGCHGKRAGNLRAAV
jgi:hypothetical protein